MPTSITGGEENCQVFLSILRLLLIVAFAQLRPTPALCGHARALTGRTQPKLPPKRLWRAIMWKLQRAGMVSTNALL
jgi:hypothetical protein